MSDNDRLDTRGGEGDRKTGSDNDRLESLTKCPSLGYLIFEPNPSLGSTERRLCRRHRSRGPRPAGRARHGPPISRPLVAPVRAAASIRLIWALPSHIKTGAAGEDDPKNCLVVVPHHPGLSESSRPFRVIRTRAIRPFPSHPGLSESPGPFRVIRAFPSHAI